MRLVGIIVLVFFVMVKGFSQDEEYTVTGEYHGKNIYVQNPLSSDKINFCTKEVYLNEKLVLKYPKTSAFEINLQGLSVGDPIFIKIIHYPGCYPKIINPQVIRSKSKFQFLNVTADAESIKWSTVGELPFGKFFLEHYLYKNWINEETISGKGSFESNQYSVVSRYHSGENRFRIKHLQNDGKIFYSSVFSYNNNIDPVSFYPALVDDKITLSRETPYKVVDTFGNVVFQGDANEINVMNLKAGLYFLHIDNREERFVKK